MVGDQFDNQLLGRPGADTYHAADGNDSILANSGTPEDDPDATIDCGQGFDTAQIDQPANGPDPAPIACEAVEERNPNSFRPPNPPPIPDTSIGTKPPTLTNSTTAEFSFSASPTSGASFECKLDAGSFGTCASPKSYAGLAGNGAQTGTAHTFQVRAMSAGGTDPSPAAYTWTIDTVKPTVDITGPPPTPAEARASPSPSRPTSPRPTSAAWRGRNRPTPPPAPLASPIRACPTATTRSGRRHRPGRQRRRSRQLRLGSRQLDRRTAAADSGHLDRDQAAGGQRRAHRPNSASAPPLRSGPAFECSLDGAAFTVLHSSYGYSGLAGDGAPAGTAHTFRVRAKNVTGTDPSPATYTWTVDTVRPEVSLTGRPADPSGGATSPSTSRPTSR